MHEQLRDILNKCVNNWWKPFWEEYTWSVVTFRCYSDWLDTTFHLLDDSAKLSISNSYHDLFSKDSWLIEFVEWKEKKFRTKYRPFLSWHVFWILWTPFEFWVMGSWWHIDCDSNFNWTIQQFHYMIMWPMTAEEKIKYFIDNVII